MRIRHTILAILALAACDAVDSGSGTETTSETGETSGSGTETTSGTETETEVETETGTGELVADAISDVLAAEHDRTAPPEVARRMAERIPGAALAIVPGAGHLLPIEQPQAFADAVAALPVALGAGRTVS